MPSSTSLSAPRPGLGPFLRSTPPTPVDGTRSCNHSPPMLGNTSGLPPPSSVHAASRSSSARRLSGTRCSRFIFIRAAGMVYTWASMSISPTAPPEPRRTSPDRAAVKTRNSNASFVPVHARDDRTRSIGPRDLAVRQRPHVLHQVALRTERRRDAVNLGCRPGGLSPRPIP